MRAATVALVPRPLRSQLPDGCFHVTTRGVDGCPIYRDDDDRLAFLTMLALCVRRHGWTVHAYCLMSNHYHLIVRQ